MTDLLYSTLSLTDLLYYWLTDYILLYGWLVDLLQMATYGRRDSPAVICAKIDAVSAQDIMDCARRFVEGSPGPAIAVVGHDTSHMVDYPVIRAFTHEYMARFR